MGTGSKLLQSLAEVDVASLDARQREVLAILQALKPASIQRRAERFKRWIEQRPIRPPTTSAAARSLDAALRTGHLLNTLHPNPQVALHFLQMSAAALHVEAPTELVVDDCGFVAVVRLGLVRQQRRRARLSKLPSDWFERSLVAARRSSRALRLGMLAMALTGCRPCEVSSLRCDSTTSGLKILIHCAKSSRAEPDKRPRFRLFHFVRSGELGQWLAEFERLLAFDQQSTPLAAVTAKSLENLCRRISASEFPKLKLGLTPSCFRNLFAADLKRDGCPREQIACFIGHESTKTATVYGVSNQGRKGRRDCLLQPHQLTSSPSEQRRSRQAYG